MNEVNALDSDYLLLAFKEKLANIPHVEHVFSLLIERAKKHQKDPNLSEIEYERIAFRYLLGHLFIF
jgi:hypothetical protein